MFKAFGKIIGLFILIVSGSVGLYIYQDHYSASHEIQRLEEQKRVLEQVVDRLGFERRVADLLVTDQRVIDGVPYTTLLFVEYARDGSPLPAKSIQILGNPVHIDAMVVNFDRKFIHEGHALKGGSIALFTKIYGDHEKPVDGHVIDEPGRIPQFYRGNDPRVSEFERELWQNFWRLVDDEDYRAEKGVRVASGRGVWTHFQPDRLYSIRLEADGGTYITSEPLQGIYRAALQERGQPAVSPVK